MLSVTVSIGAAEPGRRLKTPAEVVKGADEALYRAKERGRNQVSR
jgi:diguanylate cyclase (GGDEF)-like protein